jgi:hypothetical protein
MFNPLAPMRGTMQRMAGRAAALRLGRQHNPASACGVVPTSQYRLNHLISGFNGSG